MHVQLCPNKSQTSISEKKIKTRFSSKTTFWMSCMFSSLIQAFLNYIIELQEVLNPYIERLKRKKKAKP